MPNVESRGGGQLVEVNQTTPPVVLQAREVGQQVQAGTGLADAASPRPDLSSRAEVTAMGGPGAVQVESVPIGLPVAEVDAGDPAVALQGQEVGVQLAGSNNVELSSRAPITTPTVGGGAQAEDTPSGLPVAEVEQDQPPVVLLGREIGVQVI